MPENSLSIWHLISEAGPLVKCVMALLLLLSIASWFFIVQRGLYQMRAKWAYKDFETQFWSGGDLTQLYRQGNSKSAKESIDGIESIFRAGFKEFTRLKQQGGIDPEAIMEGTQRAMRVAKAREEEKLEAYLSFLASVASVSPYIGLFGTVWGIMNSFRGLATQSQATLAVVAPGISEALVATAMGLFAAIPAVLAYNRFAANAEFLGSRYETFSEEFSSILHRQAHTRAA